MANLLKTVRQIVFTNAIKSRTFTTSTPKLLKEIQETKEKDAIIYRGVEVQSDRKPRMIKEACEAKFCPECTLGLDIKHTDVLILSQYVRSDGCMLPKRITGLCKRQQKKIGTLVTMAQKAGLMSNLTPAKSKKDPKKRYGWKKYNKYFYESTIKY